MPGELDRNREPELACQPHGDRQVVGPARRDVHEDQHLVTDGYGFLQLVEPDDRAAGTYNASAKTCSYTASTRSAKLVCEQHGGSYDTAADFCEMGRD